jgi:hypothetical protein
MKRYLVTHVNREKQDANATVRGVEIDQPNATLGHEYHPGSLSPGDVVTVDGEGAVRSETPGLSGNPLEREDLVLTYLIEDVPERTVYAITLVGPYLPTVHRARKIIAERLGQPELRFSLGSFKQIGEVTSIRQNSKGYVEIATHDES